MGNCSYLLSDCENFAMVRETRLLVLDIIHGIICMLQSELAGAWCCLGRDLGAALIFPRFNT